ncbi:hypothetical protein GW915_02705 [bacterium]|nr:hypothetical protein [bacterium]
MKTIFTALSSIFIFTAFAQEGSNQRYENKVRQVKEYTSSHQIQLNEESVRCSRVGYSVEELKVSVPSLKLVAIFDHANFGEALPCVTAGRCQEGNMPKDILNNGVTFVNTDIEVKLKETYMLDHQEKTCLRYLTENVKTDILGKDFTHEKINDIGSFPYELCQQI